VKLLTALVLPFAVGAAVLGPKVIHLLYGSDFDTAGTALRLLSPAILFYAVSYLAGYLVVSQDRSLVLTLVYVAVAVENVLANLVLIPAFSLNGAAVGTSISELLAAVALVWAARRSGGDLLARTFAGPALAAALAAGAMWALRGELSAAVAAGLLVYVTVLVAFERLVFPDDTAGLLSSLRPGR
jgi:O-antigen/teichoic acid export membrane protein